MKSPGLVLQRGVGTAWHREALPHGIQLFGRWLGIREGRRREKDLRLEKQKAAKAKWKEIHKMVRGLEHFS